MRVIDNDGQMAGVVPLNEALNMAESRGLDLIEIAPNVRPPTCKIMDYGKWKYESKKKASNSRKKQTIVNTKEIQLRPRTDEHDLMVKMRNARKFLLSGDKVKVNLRFSGREMAHQDLGLKLLKRVMEILSEVGVSETKPKLEGRQMFTLMAPDPSRIKEYQDKLNQEKKVAEVTEKEL